MSHVLMVSTPAHGHVNPTLAVIAELVRRGHRVDYAMDPAFAEQVASTGATLVPYVASIPVEADPDDQWPDDVGEASHRFLTQNIELYPLLADRFDDDRPDLLLYDISGYVARALGERWGVPAVQLSPSMVAWDGFADDMAETMDPIHATPGWRAYQAAFRGWLDSLGITQAADDFAGAPERCVATIPRAMQPNADRVDPARYDFVGPCHDDRGHQGGWTPPEDGRPVLLVSFGSAYTDHLDVCRAAIAAFADDWTVVLAIGRRIDPTDLGPLPPSVQAHAWAPQLAILRHADAFVTHAGMGGCAEGMATATPMVAVPQAVDQFGNADRLVELGVGCRLTDAEAADPALLRAAVDELRADPEVASRLDALRAQSAAEGGTHRAVEVALRAL